MLELFLGFIIPFAGTTFGSALVFFTKKQLGNKTNSLLLGFSAGIMVAASIWSLLLPAIESSKSPSWAPSSIGLLLGLVFLFLIDNVFPQKETNISKQNKMMLLAISVHNIPEGMAVGVALAGAYFGFSEISLTASLTLAIGIAIQNFPEGSIVSLPLCSAGMSKSKSFLWGILSGVIEPIASVITFFIAKFVSNILPFVLSFAAGTMFYVVVNEILPEAQTEKHKNLSTIGFFVGFLIMMILDIALG